MALGAFDDREHPPDDDQIEAALGRSFQQWNALLRHLGDTYAPLSTEWGFTGVQYGWSLRLRQKKRSIVYLMPCRKHFLASTAYGERAVSAARASDLAESTLVLIDAAPKFAEGRAVRFAVRTKKDREQVEQLLRIKMSI